LKSIEEVSSKKYEYAITMLPSGKHVFDTYFGELNLSGRLNKDCLAIDSSTISPMDTIDIATKLRNESGIEFLDAPVSGGVAGAQNATLSFMVGSESSELFEVIILNEN
jgi:3-hydroxyisobutyrate dehydrogenase